MYTSAICAAGASEPTSSNEPINHQLIGSAQSGISDEHINQQLIGTTAGQYLPEPGSDGEYLLDY